MKRTIFGLQIRLLLLWAVAACGGQHAEGQDDSVRIHSTQQSAASEFARLIERLSETGGFFDTDNLISNERSYLHVIGKLHELEVSGGAYIGVGPAQNFSYIAQIRPEVAFIIDIRRDNMLEHLLFKALFEIAHNRIEYLSLLTGRPAPKDKDKWAGRSIAELIEYVDEVEADSHLAQLVRATIAETVIGFGLPLEESDLRTIDRFHRAFIGAGLNLQFHSFNRPPRRDYPSLRQLLLETDLNGRQANYLARESDFQFIKQLQSRDLIVPVVGDLAGPHALPAIGEYISAQDYKISALYTSNVEFYLMRQGTFGNFARAVEHLPVDNRSIIIRSYFNRGFSPLPSSYVPGYNSTQLLQTLESFVAESRNGGYRTYWDVVSKHSIRLR
ncbi:MAG: hypothetical protein P8X82_04470, partial [Gemmatimonadales bacterium]|jgi:hypothetical protein